MSAKTDDRHKLEPGSWSEMDRREELEAFDLIHRLREAAYSHAFSQLYAPGKLEEAKHVPPDAQMLSKGIRFGALLIENDAAYPKVPPLSDRVNDIALIGPYLMQYLNVLLDSWS